ncbi:hypothetical protein GALL_110090 [mine drainage metagenome]|uniref:Fimbrial assembly protein (PilN) n=1 Tax=mine drainage metagenome TaxID=410659 RepID=A0A1J5SEA0_9ZZZZ
MQDSVSLAGKGVGRSEWVLSRPLYRYARFELKSVPKPQRAQALALQIRQWTPFVRTGWYLLWEQDEALIWAWDADRVEAAIRENNLKPRTVSIVPETLLQQGQEQGIHLVSCIEGYEGQVWSERSLLASRWWPELPDTAAWLNFQRDAGTLPERQSNAVPKPLPLHWMERPWAKSAALDRSAAYGASVEQWALPAVALCLLAASFWYGAQWIKLQSAIKNRSVELEALNLRAGPIIEARGQALEALGRIRALQATDPYPDQLSLLAKVAQSLPKDGSYLKEWEFQSGKLKLQIASPNKMVSSDYVKLFQSFGIFKNVQTAANNDPASLALSMDVLPQAEIKFAAEGNVAARKEGAR